MLKLLMDRLDKGIDQVEETEQLRLERRRNEEKLIRQELEYEQKLLREAKEAFQRQLEEERRTAEENSKMELDLLSSQISVDPLLYNLSQKVDI
jgi:hypothetical protein